jgi:hypothetical protein
VVASGGRRSFKMAPNPSAENEEDPLEAFTELIRSVRPKSLPSIPSKFVKRMEEIPTLELSPEQPCNLALYLAEKALIGNFTGYGPAPKRWMHGLKNDGGR